MQIEAELDVGVCGGPQSERVHPLAHEPVKRADHRLSMTAGRRLWCAVDRAALANRRVSRSLHKCRPSAAKLETVQRNSRTYEANLGTLTGPLSAGDDHDNP